MAKFFDLTTGEYREADPGNADGDMALAGAHCRGDIERDIDRAMKRIRLEKRAKDIAESKQFVRDRDRAHEILNGHADALGRYLMNHNLWHEIREEPTLSIALARKRLRSVAWFDPALVIKLFEKMEGRG